MIIPLAGRLALAHALAGDAIDQLHLFQNDHEPSLNSTLAQLTEADYDGYTAAPLFSPAAAGSLDEEDQARIDWDQVNFMITGENATPNLIYGWYLTNTHGLVALHRLSAPVLLDQEPDQLGVEPFLLLPGFIESIETVVCVPPVPPSSMAFSGNVAFDIYRAGRTPPSEPDIANVAGLLRSDFVRGQEAGDRGSPATALTWTHILLCPADVDIRDAHTGPGATSNQDRVYIPADGGTGYQVVFIENVNPGGPAAHKRVYLCRLTPAWPTNYL